jgi:hypothetical protein
MDKKQIVAKAIPAWGSEGLTFKEICSKISGVKEGEASLIIEDLFRNLKIEMITCGDGSPKYRCCNGVEL